MMKRWLEATWLTVVLCHTFLLYPAFAGGASSGPLPAEEVRDKLKGAKLLTIQDYKYEKVNPLDQHGWGEVNAPVKDYDRNYPKRLKDYLGIEIVKVGPDELLAEVAKVDEKKTQEVAGTWMSDATDIKVVKRKDLVRNAKLYLAVKELLRKYDADAVTMATWHLAGNRNPEGSKTNVMFPMAILELSKEHIPCCCESLLDCMVTMMVGTHLTGGRMGFAGDVLNGWAFKPTGARPQDVIVVGHCGAPINPKGDGRIPYVIRDHVIRQWGKKWAKKFDEKSISVATTVQWPTDEPATVVKFDVYRKKVSVFTGRVLDGNALYENFADHLCRNKIVVKLDHPKRSYLLPSKGDGAFRSWWGTWGCHQVVFYGDIKEPIKQFAALVGFKVVE